MGWIWSKLVQGTFQGFYGRTFFSSRRTLQIAEWGAVFEPEFTFVDYEWSALNTTIPATVPDGEVSTRISLGINRLSPQQYLLRVEHIALHVAGSPQFYVSCAQISVTGGGNANPDKVSIPGYISSDDPSITLNIWVPVPTEYTVSVFIRIALK